jgi:hypothetical protein
MCLCIVLFWKILHPSGCAVSQWETSILKWPNMACPTSKEAPDGRKLLQCIIANGGLVQPANERPVCCPGVIWITHAVGTVRNLAYLAFACHMRWTGEVSIIITLDWENGIRVVKRCMTFESGPECILTLFWAIYALVLIQCRDALVRSQLVVAGLVSNDELPCHLEGCSLVVPVKGLEDVLILCLNSA